MDGQSRNDRVVRVQNLTDYFRTSIDGVISRQGVDVDPHAAHYVVNLLTLFSRSEELYEDHGESYGLRPLALMMADAAEARTAAARNYALQRIANKPVDVDYYIHMGGTAYGSLSEEVRGTFRGNAFADIYRELAVKFQILVDVLNEVRDEARGESDRDLLRTYEIWLKTGSRRARKLLADNGVVPISDARPKGGH
jgi:hypothetical protein